jgi:hypothetical protein
MKSFSGAPSVGRNGVGAKRNPAASRSNAPNGNNDTIVDYNLLSPSVATFLKIHEREGSQKGSKRAPALPRIGAGATRNLVELDKHEAASPPNGPTANNSGIFDYSTVPPSVATFLKNQAERIRRSGASFVLNIGKDLIGAKRYLSRGAFLHWVEAEAGIPARTAQVYMQVAQWAGSKSATVAHLPLTALYLLSARSTPNEFATDVLNRVQGGESVSLTAIREELKAVRKKLKGASNREGTVQPIEAKGTIAQDGPSKRDVSPEFRTDALFSESPFEQIALSLASEINESKVLSSASLLAEAVNIMVSGLSEASFARVREIMTSNLVVEDPELPQNLMNAFAACLGAERPSQDYHITTFSG